MSEHWSLAIFVLRLIDAPPPLPPPLQSPTTTHVVCCRQYIDQFKAQSEFLFQTGFQFALPSGGDDPHEGRLRFFGLQLVEHSIEQRWDVYDEAVHSEVKQSLLQLMFNGTLPLEEEFPFVRNKIASIVAEVAVRTWPQRWPEFMDQLVDLCREGPTQIDLVSELQGHCWREDIRAV